LQRRGASIILASHQKKAGLELAKELGCRFVLFEALYSTMHDVLIVVDEEKDQMPTRPGSSGIHTGYLKPGMTVMDLTAGLTDTALTWDSAARSCLVVRARQLLVEQLNLQARMLTSTQVPMEVLTAALPSLLADAEGNA